MTYAPADTKPMSDLNTTPLIDVLLVLLIMFIITIPVQTHAVKVDLPVGPPPPGVEINPIKNKITIGRDDRVRWNGEAVDLATLRRALDASAALPRVPELHIQPDPEARYEVVDEVLAVTKRARVDAMGFVGNEAYRNF